MKTKLKSMFAVALCAVGLSAFAKEPDAVQLWKDGPYWATVNLGDGATKPEDYGAFYTYVEAENAAESIGTGWRLPTEEEVSGLFENYCTGEWTTQGGINGYLYTSKSDSSKSIFLPAVGWGDLDKTRNDAGVTGGYWFSQTVSEEFMCYLYFSEAWGSCLDWSEGAIAPLCPLAVRAVRDTPPTPEISAVSNKFALDLTVGDRIAKDVETIVVDPAWDETDPTLAKVQIDGEDEPRTYTCASNDLWQTASLEPGRYEAELMTACSSCLAGFWKIGADWVVFDGSNITADVTFEADKTYLVLGTNTVDGATLKVTDGAKFEYAEGAGFKGGTVEMSKRYEEKSVEGGLFQIAEKIKGCEDNPWEVGDGVTAYTNGNELVISGEGTITDLSEIPAGVKDAVETVTVSDATVKGAADDAFTGTGGFMVTLPDNWQGALPNAGGKWYGATNVGFTRVPMAVKNVKVTQRYPWNGLMDVKFDLTGEGYVAVSVQVMTNGVMAVENPTVVGGTTFDLGSGGELKGQKITWDAKADFGDGGVHEKIKVKLSVSSAESD